MEKLILIFVGKDDWGNDTYKDENGKFFKNIGWGHNVDICTVSNNELDGEPDTPVERIERYKNVEIVLTGKPEEPSSKDKFNYMMLSRLQSDCNYYLGNGGRNIKSLWADDEEEQIDEMKKIYNSFDDDKKPEWLTWEEILEYEKQMIG